MEFFFARSSHVILRETNGSVAKYRLFAQQALKGEGEGGILAREGDRNHSSLARGLAP